MIDTFKMARTFNLIQTDDGFEAYVNNANFIKPSGIYCHRVLYVNWYMEPIVSYGI